jgi:hypothetical protein
VLLHERQPCALAYSVQCDNYWRTLGALVSGWVGECRIDARVSVEAGGHWLLNGIPQPQVHGADDVDLNFSPSTNSLPIRRLGLPVGGSAMVKAAWLRFPAFTLEPLEQRYTRLADREWRYESANGSFVTDLEVDEHGLVVRYGDLWIRE